MTSGSATVSAQLQIRFITKQEQYAVPDTPFSVASSICSKELNSLVNELLRESQPSAEPSTRRPKDVDFDFLVCGEFLRVALIEHLDERAVSSEATIEVEYLERHPAPEPQDCLLHDDWVSAVEVRDGWILSGCYDNTLHVWTARGVHRLTIPGHDGPIRDVAWVRCDGDTAVFVSASHDQTAMLWECSLGDNAVECIHVCKGHERGLECVAVNSSAKLMATGGWDTLLKIWSADIDDVGGRGEGSEGASAAKRSKTERKSLVRTPVMTLSGHKESVSGAAWTGVGTVATASWDHTVRLWDAETGGITDELVGNKAFFDVDWSPISGALLTASADRHVRLYDPRSREGSVVKSTFTSHTQWVQSVRWSSDNGHLFISGAYDNQVKLWDSRSPKAPLFDMSGHEDKVLCCDWSNPKLMVSGGADNTIRIFKSKHVPSGKMDVE